MPRSKHRKKPARNKLSRRFMDASDLLSSGEDRKMSAVLLEFIEPYREYATDDAAIEKLVGLGVIAWNLALLPSGDREQALDEFAADLFQRQKLFGKIGSWIRKRIRANQPAGAKTDSPAIADFKQTVREMIERKLNRFARNRRFIINYRVAISEDDVQLVVVSTLDGM